LRSSAASSLRLRRATRKMSADRPCAATGRLFEGGREKSYNIGRRVTSAEALAAIEATLSEGSEADRRPDGKGGFTTIAHGVVEQARGRLSRLPPRKPFTDL
jgi:hypothetical protein